MQPRLTSRLIPLASLLAICGSLLFLPFSAAQTDTEAWTVPPAYKQLAGMDFSKLRVLILPTSFAADWADQGYPYEKGD
jgi:LPS O-antigen subunit length determinant protein (WzzB/FepE family)